MRSCTNCVTPNEIASKNFRPINTYHRQLSGYDFANGIYYYNVGEGAHRQWDDYKRHGFISAGQGPRWRNAMLGLQAGDVVAAYLRRFGFVGIGQVTEPARPIRDVTIGGQPLLTIPLICRTMADNIESDDSGEYVCLVECKVAVDRSEAKWQSRSGLFTTTHVRASLEGQPATLDFLEREFGIVLRDLVV